MYEAGKKAEPFDHEFHHIEGGDGRREELLERRGTTGSRHDSVAIGSWKKKLSIRASSAFALLLGSKTISRLSNCAPWAVNLGKTSCPPHHTITTTE